MFRYEDRNLFSKYFHSENELSKDTNSEEYRIGIKNKKIDFSLLTRAKHDTGIVRMKS